MMSTLKENGSSFLKMRIPGHPEYTFPKASKNHIKMVQHLMRIGAKMVQNQGLEGIWAAFGRLWGSLGHLLAPRHLCAASLAPFGQLFGGS